MRRDRTAVAWSTCTEDKYERAVYKIIFSSADVDGGALRAINIVLMKISKVFLINLFAPAHYRIQGFSKVL